MKILLFIAIGFIAGYVAKDLLTTESQVVYRIRKLRAKKGGEVTVDTNATVVKQTRRERRKNKK